MDDLRFDELTRAMAAGASRRILLKGLAAGLTGALGGALHSGRVLADPGNGRQGGQAKGRCPEGFVNCQGDCVILAEDPNNCGGCSVVCPPARSCRNGQCVVECDLGQRDCGGGVCVPATSCCPGETRACYTGPAGTEGVGICHGGNQSCQADGAFGPCEGEVTPQPESCNGLDNDCDGQIDDADEIITCGVGACMRSVPACIDGVPQTCVPGTPQPETCNGIDDDCDGEVDEGVVCPDRDFGEFCQTDHVGQTRCCYVSGAPAPASGLGVDCDRCCSRSCDFFGRCA